MIRLNGHTYDMLEETDMSVEMVMDEIELIRASPWPQQQTNRMCVEECQVLYLLHK